MSSLAFLVTELQSLASETKRKHPDIREAAERSLVILRSSPEQATTTLASDGPQSEDLLRPVFMGCATKNAKVVAISLGSLQRLIALQAVPVSVVPKIVNTMGDCMTQGVDIQLRILQTLVSLITNFRSIHGDLLADALILCFKMHESRIAVVSSTAAATLRQLVMFIVDKVVDEDMLGSDATPVYGVTLPDNTTKSIAASAKDAFQIFEDLCLLANSEKPNFLLLDSLQKTFALELIESVLTNYHDLFRKHPELLSLLRHHLSPMLHRTLSERPIFPLTLRSTRVVFLLLKQFSAEMVTESEVFLSLLFRIVSGDNEDPHQSHSTRPQWMRVLAMEIIRGLCNDAELMRGVWDRYDSQSSGSSLFSSLITVLKRLVTEKPAILGVSAQMFGLGVSAATDSSSTAPPSSGSGYSFDVMAVASMVATAASATVSGVVGMIGTEHGLSLTTSTMRLQCIDQLDKADAPPIPESYIYLLGVQCLVSLCEGFASLTLPLFNSLVVQRPRVAGDAVIRAPPAIDFALLQPEQLSTKQLKTVHDMVDNGWPGLLAALSFILATNLSDDLFADVLQSYQNVANVAGMLGLTTPRDAFLTSLAKFAIPTRVVTSLESYVEPQTPRTASGVITENLGLPSLTGNPTQAPGLSERNLACLKVLTTSALFLAGSLGPSWFDLLEALQNADYVLTAKGSKPSISKRNSIGPVVSAGRTFSGNQAHPGNQPPPPRHPLYAELDIDNVQRSIQRLFDSSKNLDDSAFSDFVSALCKLSSEMIEMQSENHNVVVDSTSMDDVSSSARLRVSVELSAAHRRRVSGIHLPKTLRSGDFGINKLSHVALLNVHRLVYRSRDIAWDTITSHLVSTLQHNTAPHLIRIQAARALDDILSVIPRNWSSGEDLKERVQRQTLDALSEQISLEHYSINSSTVTEIRKMGLETLHHILQSAAHTFVVGWETIFEMLGSVCDPIGDGLRSPGVDTPTARSPLALRPKPLPLGYNNNERGNALVRIAFQSLTLVCASLSTLSPDHLRLCISTLGRFGRQRDTNIALTAAGSLLWEVSDSIQAKRKDTQHEPEYSALWMFLLLEVLGLCSDSRSEVRVGAIQTLFRTLQLYGMTLSLETWDECIWKVTFPLLEAISDCMHRSDFLDGASDELASSQSSWDDSKVLALQSVGSVFGDFLVSKIMHLSSFEKVWDVFIQHMQDSFTLDRPAVSTAALRCFEKAVKSATGTPAELTGQVTLLWQRSWAVCDEMGSTVLRRATASAPPLVSSPVSSRFSGVGGPLSHFEQDTLLAFVDVIRAVRAVSKHQEQSDWPIGHLTRLMEILKGVLTYSHSSAYRPDVDGLTPVQASTLDAIVDIDLTVPQSPSLVLRELSELATLPFVAGFEVEVVVVSSDPTQKKKTQQVTYIGLTKKVMPLLVELFRRFKDHVELYVDDTLVAILSAYAVPIKLKYECPPSSKFGKEEPPLWKTATTCFLHVIKEFTDQFRQIGDSIPADKVEGIWRTVVHAFRGGVLADCSAAESSMLEEQEAEENFDLALIASLEVDVVPLLGDERVPDDVVVQLAKFLYRGSWLYDLDADDRDLNLSNGTRSPTSRDGGRANNKRESINGNLDRVGSTASGVLLPRERFSYWCFDLLFLICSDTVKDSSAARRRVATLCLPSLLDRCRTTLRSYIADEALRGNYPFPRAREEELVYVLRKIWDLTVWPGTLWAALSGSPSKYSSVQPDIDGKLAPKALIADAIKRSVKGILFFCYKEICQIAALPRNPPSAWVPVGGVERNSSEPSPPSPRGVSTVEVSAKSGVMVEYDVRQLAYMCLEEIGNELSI